MFNDYLPLKIGEFAIQTLKIAQINVYHENGLKIVNQTNAACDNLQSKDFGLVSRYLSVSERAPR